ncbi:uncharacterized protein FTJAE_1476 [Fusarium tjaetaba]|uniref:C2H2-type domain-containing protein n=1 Tax=Fusarium tjaetaba TaxID=1567544 RepID=A0A8H5W776_9HYPO|nr:uncharacterized protein FTJAE_1476 [Fusarium tjaetaba]KAF5647793.1 hypothetical protein FTJAE_1476 [Fusarium tjaetaba]
MNLGNCEPHQGAGQGGRCANKRRRQDQNDGVDDGPKYPLARLSTLSFECPFSKLNPHQYPECRGYRLSRLSDVMQHIKRQHHIREVKIKHDATVREEDAVLYCARCRDLFRGMGAAYRLRIHSTSEPQCHETDIERSGVTIPKELKALKSELELHKRESEMERWYIIWDRLFPGKDRPRSPHVEISVPRLQVESILRDELQSKQGLGQERAQSIIRQATDRIYKTSPQPRSSSSVPPQAQPNNVHTAPIPSFHTPSYLPSNPPFTSQALQSQTQGFNHNAGQPSAAGVYVTPNTFTEYCAPSPVPGSEAYTNSGNTFVPTEYSTVHDSLYSVTSYNGYPNAPFEPATEDHNYSNAYGNDSSHF